LGESQNVAAVRRYMDAFNRLELDAVIADLDPDAELHEWPEAPGARSYRGAEGVGAAIDAWLETWEWMRVEIEDIVDAGDHVFITLHQRAKGKQSEAEVETRSFNVYTFREGKVICVRLFLDRESALEAAGIRTNQEEVRP
jgi:ketosteroid isomerase-like protein